MAQSEHMAGPRKPHGRLRGAYVAPTWREEIFGLADDGPTGIVGPSYSIGAVTHLH